MSVPEQDFTLTSKERSRTQDNVLKCMGALAALREMWAMDGDFDEQLFDRGMRFGRQAYQDLEAEPTPELPF